MATPMFSLDHRTFLEQDFAVIDPLQVDAALWKHLPATTLGEKEFNCDMAQLPHLLCLRDADELTRLELLNVCEAFTATEDAAFFCCLIRTKESASSLTRRLSRRMVLTRSSNGRKYFFRYFDPRVFLHLLHILNDEQMYTLLTPAAAWAWRDPLVQQWCEHCVAAQAAAAWPAPTFSLTDKQLDSIARIEVVNQVLRRLQSQQGKQAVAQAMLPAIDAHALRAVETERLVDADDQVQFVLDAIEYGAQIHQAPAVRQVIDGARGKEMSYVGGMSALRERDILTTLRLSRSNVPS